MTETSIGETAAEATGPVYDCLIISDLHLGSMVCQAKLLEEFLEWAVRHSRELVINGDVFDDLNFKRLTKRHFACLKVIRRNSDRDDFKLVWVRGNHDGPADIVGHIVGVEVLDEYVYRNSDLSLLIIHGDQFDTIVTSFVWLTELFCGLYYYIQKWMPHRTARWIRRVSKKFQRNSQRIERGASKYAQAHGFSHVTCGHTHLPLTSEVDGIHYVNSGTWCEAPPARSSPCWATQFAWSTGLSRTSRRPSRPRSGRSRRGTDQGLGEESRTGLTPLTGERPRPPTPVFPCGKRGQGWEPGDGGWGIRNPSHPQPNSRPSCSTPLKGSRPSASSPSLYFIPLSSSSLSQSSPTRPATWQSVPGGVGRVVRCRRRSVILETLPRCRAGQKPDRETSPLGDDARGKRFDGGDGGPARRLLRGADPAGAAELRDQPVAVPPPVHPCARPRQEGRRAGERGSSGCCTPTSPRRSCRRAQGVADGQVRRPVRRGRLPDRQRHVVQHA